MWNVSYTACSFVMHKKRKINERCFLYEKCIKNENENKLYNAKEVIEKYIDSCNKLRDNVSEKRLFKMKKVKEGIEGKIEYVLVEIESGRYGYASSITNKDTQKVTYEQKETDASLMKFEVAILFPKDMENKKAFKGFMFFQNYGQYGIKTETIRGLKNFLSSDYNATIWVGNISPDIFIDTMLKEENLQKICFVNNKVSIDSSDNMSFAYGKEQRIIEKIKLAPSFISKLKGYMKGNSRIFEFENKEYDDVKVELKIGERKRIIGLNNIERVSIIESLPEDLIKNGEIDRERYIKIILERTSEYMEKVICYG